MFKYICVIILHGMITSTQTDIYCQGSDTSPEEMSLDSLLNLKISTAAKYEQTTQEAPAAVKVITSDDIQRFGYRTVLEALMSVAGLYTSNDRNYTYLGIRGFSRPGDYNDRIILLLDGHMLNESYFGSAAFDAELGVNMSGIDCIEVVQGPGSVLYGAGAVFAVVNIITKKGIAIDGVDFAVEGGSFNRYQGSVLLGKRSDNGIEYSLSAIYSDSKGEDLFFPEFYHPPETNGVSNDLDWERYYGFQYSLSYSDFTLSGDMSSRKKGIPTAPYDVTFNDPRAQSRDDHFFTELKYQQDITSDKNIFARGYFDSYYCDGYYPYTSVLNSVDCHTYSAGSELRLQWDLAVGNRLIVGTEYRNIFKARYKSMDDGIPYSDTDYPYWSISAYVQDEVQFLENLIATIGVREDKYSTVGRRFNPRASFVYFPFPATTIKLLYGEAYRAPNVYELHFQDFESSPTATANLTFEKIRTRELVWEQRFHKHFLGMVSLFDYDMYNLVDLSEDSSVFQFQNINHIHSAGIASSLICSLIPQVRGYLNYSFQYTRDVTRDQKLTNSPSHIVQGGVGFPVLNQIYMGVECRYESKRITVYQTSTDPFFSTNMNISVQTPSERLRGSLQIRNVFNTSYQTPGSLEHVQPAITQDGRTYTVRLEYVL
jgi:outer membrane receptor for ferrienterochelin and colicins